LCCTCAVVCRTWSQNVRTIRGVRWRPLGVLAHGESAIVWSLHGPARFDDGVSIDGPMRRPDVFKMQSVRHTPACISVGGWFVQGVEIAWPSVSGASHFCSPWASPHRVSASAHSPWAQTSGNGTGPGVAFSGGAKGDARCLTGQTASVHVVLAGLHIHTGRLRWRDFGFEFLATAGS
jgi:hypothetical protein